MRRVSLKPSSQVGRLRDEIVAERKKLRALQEISIALGSSLDLDELLDLLLSRIQDVMGAERSTLYLLDEAGERLVSKVPPGSRRKPVVLALGDGLVGAVAKSGEPLMSADVYEDTRFDPQWDDQQGFRTTSTLCVPLKNQHGRAIGVIQVDNKIDGVFNDDDVAMLSALSTQAAVSIENSKLFLSVVSKNIELLDTKEQLESKIRELDILFDVAAVSATASNLDELMHGMLEKTMQAVDAEASAILIADEFIGDLKFVCAVGGNPEKILSKKIRAGQGVAGWVAENQLPQVVNELDQDDRHSRKISEDVGYYPKSLLCVPMRWDDGVGVVELLNKSGGRSPFTEDDTKLATMIAGHISAAIATAQSRQKRSQQERLSTLGQFLSSMLHDLKTPLTVIAGYTRLLIGEESESKRKEYAQTIEKQLQLLKTMTGETLAFAKGERKIWIRRVYLIIFRGAR
ncbi:MAG: GAF domain-containing protein [Polyangiales bacterium]